MRGANGQVQEVVQILHARHQAAIYVTPDFESSSSTELDTFNDRQSQIAERKTGGGRGPGDRSREAA
jgi:hypothetical protein